MDNIHKKVECLNNEITYLTHSLTRILALIQNKPYIKIVNIFIKNKKISIIIIDYI